MRSSDDDLRELSENLPQLLNKLFGTGIRSNATVPRSATGQVSDDAWAGVGWLDYNFQTSDASEKVMKMVMQSRQEDKTRGLFGRFIDIIRKPQPLCLFLYPFDQLPVRTREALRQLGGHRQLLEECNR